MAFIARDDLLEGSPLPGWRGRFFHSEHMTVGHWDIAPDAADLHEHRHLQEEVWNIVEGEAALVLEGEQRILRAGDVAVVPANARHAVRVTGACRAIVVDSPRRADLPGLRQKVPLDSSAARREEAVVVVDSEELVGVGVDFEGETTG